MVEGTCTIFNYYSVLSQLHLFHSLARNCDFLFLSFIYIYFSIKFHLSYAFLNLPCKLLQMLFLYFSVAQFCAFYLFIACLEYVLSGTFFNRLSILFIYLIYMAKTRAIGWT